MSNDEIKDLVSTSSALVGARQVEKHIIKDALRCVIVSFDADGHIRARLAALCAKHNVELVDGPPMNEFGRLCGIEVGASAAGILKSR
ncbi:MAG: ribosomal L7Ae/L30e/S12e/Gadd45 family protein [Clostridiales bacterium]|jgi:large subunit ribosomal protein L7A|nr:ribosomal L7Ae/L30e/S12e/Gadd45 family protein [Clostridiales bacterium]